LNEDISFNFKTTYIINRALTATVDALYISLPESGGIVVTGRIQNSDPFSTVASMVWFRNAGSVMSARRLREAEDRVRRKRIGSCRRMSSKSSVGREVNGLFEREVGNCVNVGVDEVVGEGQLKGNQLM